MTTTTTSVRLHKHTDAYWRVTFDNPPINMHDAGVTAGLRAVVEQIEASDTVKVVVFDSADPDFFLAHIDLTRLGDSELPTGPTGLRPWPDVLHRLERCAAVTVGCLRGRARGVGSEFLLGLDVRFASKERALLSQPEIGFGFFPGGGGLERLPLAVGRARAMEIILSGEDYDGDTAERYGWVNRALPDADLDSFVDRFASRVAGFDREAVVAAKQILNERVVLASGTDQQATEAKFMEIASRAQVSAHVQNFLQAGGQTRADLEMQLGNRLTEL